ncbi:MAG TPA: aminotransferase class III-fold pyridoxal phosphate-dependent enzyme [Chloroflexota bacterium]|nr:aminotransferase class III-fold pyridoxal phosphate-dependent enzyme [Chloroflexota bacterium]
MNKDQLDLLQWLVPGLGDVPASSLYWIERAQRALAVTTQDRDIYPVIDHTRGSGVWLYDLEGNEYLDMTSGVAVRALGFRPAGIREFEVRLADVVEELPGQDFDNIPHVLLAERLAATAPGDFDKQVFFTTSGARAVETALKAAMDQTGRQRFVAFRPAFHGRTGYALALTASKAVHKEGYPQGLDVIRTPYAYPYRSPLGSDPDTCAEFALQQLRDAILDEGTDIAGIVVESVGGEGGIIVPPPQFLRGLREVADMYGAVLIADEVQAGLGRTGSWWAIEHAGVAPDMICTAKALGGGYPMGATIGRAPMFLRASRHSETFSAEPRMALMSLFVLRSIEEHGLIDNARRVGSLMLSALRETIGQFEQVGDIRGLGFMQGVEFVEDARNKRPSPELRDRIIRNCVYKQRLWLLGSGRSTIRFLPALITDEEQALEAVARFGRAVAEEIGAARQVEPVAAATT